MLMRAFLGLARWRRRSEERDNARCRHGDATPEVLIPRSGSISADKRHGNIDTDDHALVSAAGAQYRAAAIPRFYQAAVANKPAVGRKGFDTAMLICRHHVSPLPSVASCFHEHSYRPYCIRHRQRFYIRWKSIVDVEN